jgi:2',3'-cyclic-nucleotide 2'-phosphodiesterase (5'-nucleotidase family)
MVSITVPVRFPTTSANVGTEKKHKKQQGQTKEHQMVELQEVLLLMNILAILGSSITTAISYVRGGFVHKFIHAVDKIEETNDAVKEINKWRADVEVVLIAVSASVDGVREEKVNDLFGDSVTVTELKVDREGKEKDSDSELEGG